MHYGRADYHAGSGKLNCSDDARFGFAASFHVKEDGVHHQAAMPQVPPPEGLPSMHALRRKHADRMPERIRALLLAETAIDMRPCDPFDPFDPPQREPLNNSWFRADDRLPGAVDRQLGVLYRGQQESDTKHVEFYGHMLIATFRGKL